MGHHKHKSKHHAIRNKYRRFNKNLSDQPFLEVFQKIMIERLLLNREGKYHPDNVARIIRNNKVRRNSKNINTDISGGYILSTEVEADFYILLQETIKKVTGNYMPMNEFIHILLTWFYQYYNKENNEKINLPFRYNPQNKRKKLIGRFNNKFSRFYKNI